MIRVIRVACSAMMSAFLATLAGSPAFLARPRARPTMTLSGVPTELADGRQLLGLEQPVLEGVPRLVLPRGLGPRLAERVGHLVEAGRQIADLVLALGQHHVAQVALGDVVDSGDQLADRPGHQAVGEVKDRDDHQTDDDQQ
jgi:hypothetical protein